MYSDPLNIVWLCNRGTVSWPQGNLYPSFMLLTASSLNSTSSNSSVSTSLCFLPKQTHIYIWYLCQFVVTLLLLFIWPANGFGCFGRFMGFIRSIRCNWATMKGMGYGVAVTRSSQTLSSERETQLEEKLTKTQEELQDTKKELADVKAQLQNNQDSMEEIKRWMREFQTNQVQE